MEPKLPVLWTLGGLGKVESPEKDCGLSGRETLEEVLEGGGGVIGILASTKASYRVHSILTARRNCGIRSL